MTDRMLDLTPGELSALSGNDLIESIKKSEGRVVASEIIVRSMPLLYDVSNGELAAAFGCDLLILNLYDVNNPKIEGVGEGDGVIEELKKLTGRVIGINLEPVNFDGGNKTKGIWEMSKGRCATISNVKKAISQGVSFIVLTGNPDIGVTNKAIEKTIEDIRKEDLDIVIIAGKMHASGVYEKEVSNLQAIDRFIEKGADIILLPAPGTVPSMTQEVAHNMINHIKKRGALAMTAIGTSQEGADTDTIKRIALMSKMAGADIHHIGDAGFPGIAVPENIMALSIAIRGVRHTYRRMAMSLNRMTH